ncbi:hypothetical protein ACFLZG_00965 [Thermodesulfobacteriota bacterium]
MGIAVKIKTCFALAGSGSEEMIVPSGIETIKDLMLHIGKENGFNFIDPESGVLEKDLEILVNGKEIWFYASALERLLQEGDAIEIYLLPLGGG